MYVPHLMRKGETEIGDSGRIRANRNIAIPSLVGQVNSICSVQMVRDRGSPYALLHENICRARMVHWYSFPIAF